VNRPKVLVLCSRFPEPPIGGDRLRIHRICRELSKYATLDLLTFCETDAEREARADSGLFHTIRRLDLHPLAARLRVLEAMFGSSPLQVSYYRSRRFEAALHAMVDDYDATLAHLIRMGDYIRKPIGRCVRVVEATDAISLNYSRIPPGARYSTKVLAYRLERKRLLEYERALPREFDIVSFVSSVDVDFLYPQRPSNVVVATNGVDCAQFPFIGPGRDMRIVFIGNITSEQNFDACLFFAKSVLPKLRDFRFQIVGRVPEDKASALSRLPGVEVVGEVRSVVEKAAGAFAAVCPVRIGAGVQNKVLEYLAMGIPAVSTSIGMEGIAVEHERHVLRADDPDEMAKALERLWDDPALGNALARCGREFVEENHSWERALSPLVATIMNAIDARRDVGTGPTHA
jgi:glycosyltransferase involved in cell wall biosynthesis